MNTITIPFKKVSTKKDPKKKKPSQKKTQKSQKQKQTGKKQKNNHISPGCLPEEKITQRKKKKKKKKRFQIIILTHLSVVLKGFFKGKTKRAEDSIAIPTNDEGKAFPMTNTIINTRKIHCKNSHDNNYPTENPAVTSKHKFQKKGTRGKGKQQQ